jgi:hypothetical protein
VFADRFRTSASETFENFDLVLGASPLASVLAEGAPALLWLHTVTDVTLRVLLPTGQIRRRLFNLCCLCKVTRQLFDASVSR